MRHRSLRPAALVLTSGACALLAGAAATVHAREPATSAGREHDIPVKLDYRAPAGCGQEASFVGRLTARVPRVRAASTTEHAPEVIVRVSRTSGHAAHGRFAIRDIDGSESSRDVDGETCESVERALVLVAALALDPASATGQPDNAQTDANHGASTTADGGSPTEATSPADASTSAASTASTASTATPNDAGDDRRRPGPAGAADASDAAEKDRPRGPPVDARDGWHLGAGAGVLVTSGSAPDVIVGVPVFVDLARSSPSPWSPSARLGLAYEPSGDQGVLGGQIRFTEWLGTLDLCPLRLLAGPIRLHACARGEAGVVEATGVAVTPTRSEARPWVTVGLLARGRYVFYSPFFVELSGGVRAALQRDRFFFEPTGDTVFRASLFSGFASASLGLTIL